MARVTKIFTEKEEKSTKLKVAAYCRVSTNSDEQMESLDAQKKHYQTYIKSNPAWQYAGLYYDEGITGTSQAKRPAFKKMIKDCEAGKIDMIITKSVSRFARNTVDTLVALRNLKSMGVGVYFENINTDTRRKPMIRAFFEYRCLVGV